MYRTYKIHLTTHEWYWYYINFILSNTQDTEDRILLRKLKNRMCKTHKINFIKLLR